MNNFRGVIPGLVQNLNDPQGMGRIQVNFPRMPGENRSFWASVAAPMAGKDRGFFFQPETDDEVLVAFEEGDPQHPYIVGFLWNGADTPPPGINSNGASVRRLRTVSGHVLEFDDRSGQEEVHLKTQGGQEIEMKDSPASITIKTKANHVLNLDDTSMSIRIETAGGNKITVSDKPPNITIEAQATLNVNCLQANVTANALLNVNAPMTIFNGIVQTQTLLTQAVVSSAYTPAPGNTFGL